MYLGCIRAFVFGTGVSRTFCSTAVIVVFRAFVGFAIAIAAHAVQAVFVLGSLVAIAASGIGTISGSIWPGRIQERFGVISTMRETVLASVPEKIGVAEQVGGVLECRLDVFAVEQK